MHLFKVLHPQLSLETNKLLPMFLSLQFTLWSNRRSCAEQSHIQNTFEPRNIGFMTNSLQNLTFRWSLSFSGLQLGPKIWQKLLQQVATGDDEEPTGACVGGGYRWDVQLCRPGSGRQDIVEVISTTIIIIIIIIIIIVTVIFIITMNRFNQNGKSLGGAPHDQYHRHLHQHQQKTNFAVSGLSRVSVSVSKNLVSEKSLGFSFRTVGLEKKVSVSVSENLVSEKKSRFRRIWSRKKVLVSVYENLV